MVATMSVGPFKGIIERPYDQAILKDVDWYAITPIMVRYSALWLTQTHLNIAALLGDQRFSADPYPRVVCYRDEYYLEDGHHRVLTGVLSRDNTRYALMRVWGLRSASNRKHPTCIDVTTVDETPLGWLCGPDCPTTEGEGMAEPDHSQCGPNCAFKICDMTACPARGDHPASEHETPSHG